MSKIYITIKEGKVSVYGHKNAEVVIIDHDEIKEYEEHPENFEKTETMGIVEMEKAYKELQKKLKNDKTTIWIY